MAQNKKKAVPNAQTSDSVVNLPYLTDSGDIHRTGNIRDPPICNVSRNDNPMKDFLLLLLLFFFVPMLQLVNLLVK